MKGDVMADGILIPEGVFKTMTPEERDWTIYFNLHRQNGRIKKLENRKIIHTTFSFFGGIVGGSLAFLSLMGVKFFR